MSENSLPSMPSVQLSALLRSVPAAVDDQVWRDCLQAVFASAPDTDLHGDIPAVELLPAQWQFQEPEPADQGESETDIATTPHNCDGDGADWTTHLPTDADDGHDQSHAEWPHHSDSNQSEGEGP